MPSLVGIVHRILAGDNVTLVPSEGQGDVTISVDLSSVGDLYVDVAGDTMEGNLSMGLNEILSFKVQNVGSLPSAGNLGRMVYLTTDSHLHLDQG